MIVGGKYFSEETVVKALQKYFNFEENKPYIFQSGDIVECHGQPRIILCATAYDKNGDILSSGQNQFEAHNYKKIGTLTDFEEN